MNSKPIIKIAFISKMRGGKDAAASYLSHKTKRNFTVLKFADPLYELCEVVQTFLGVEVKKDRKLLQLLGTDYGRYLNENFWVHQFEKRLKIYDGRSIICTDVRFDNELECVRKNGFIVVQIFADDSVREARGAEIHFGNHASENGFTKPINPDVIIENNGTLEEFHLQLDQRLIHTLYLRK